MKKRILVVDDEPAVSQTLRLMLTREGYIAHTAWSGKEALSILNAETFDLVITDFTMSGMKGDELAREICDRWPEMPIIMVSGSAELLRATHTALPGVDVLLNKPFNMEDFRNTLSLLLADDKCEESSAELSMERPA